MPLSSPQRTCIACRCKADQRSLLRLSGDGMLVTTSLGRSAYICPNLACLDDALRRDRLSRALRRPLTPERLADVRALLIDRIQIESA